MVADELSKQFSAKYLLAEVLASLQTPMLEFKEAKAVLIEAPAITKARYEHDMLDLVTKIHNLQTEVLLIVQPSLRRKSNRTLWVQKWNNLRKAPFKIHTDMFV